MEMGMEVVMKLNAVMALREAAAGVVKLVLESRDSGNRKATVVVMVEDIASAEVVVATVGVGVAKTKTQKKSM